MSDQQTQDKDKEVQQPQQMKKVEQINFDELKLKKKKKKKETKAEINEDQAKPQAQQPQQLIVQQQQQAPVKLIEEKDLDEDYNKYLQRIVEYLQQKNQGQSDKTKITMKPPQITRIGTKKTGWTNFEESCKRMQRDIQHVMQFLCAETGSEASISGEEPNRQLIIKAKLTNQNIELYIKKYIQEYVQCNLCRSPNTILTKDSNTRSYQMECQQCKSTRTVAAIAKKKH